MTSLISRHSTDKYYTPESRKCVAVLPDDRLAVLTFDANYNLSSFGDKSRVAKGYVRLIDPSTGTVLGETNFHLFNGPGYNVTSMQGSMVVDNSGNLHCVYTYHNNPQNTHPPSQGQQVRYIKITRSGTTLTPGAPQIVYQTNGDEAIASVDIDIPGSSGDYPVIVNAFTNWASNKSHLRIHHRQTTGTWWSDYIHELQGLYHFPSVSIGCRMNTGTGAFSYAVTYTTVPIAADQGDFIITGRFNLGGARIGTNPVWKGGLNKHQNDGWREFSVFNIYDDIFVVTGTTGVSPFRPFFAAFKINQSTGAVTTAIDPYARVDSGGYYTKYANIPFSAWSRMSFTETSGKLIAYNIDKEHAYATLFDYDVKNGVVTITPVPHRITLTQDVSKFGATTPLSVGAGDAGRFMGASPVQAVVTYAEPTYHHLLAGMEAPRGTVNVYPQNNGTTSQSSPRLEARPLGTNQSNVIGTVTFQLALDANFTSGLVTGLASTPVWANGSNIATAPLLNNRLVQGKYYMRSRITDLAWRESAWSPITSFTVRHPPSASNLTPTGGGHVGFNPEEGVTFMWSFTDPDPDDTQSAYQIVLTNTSTGAVIHNTGKQESSASQATIPVGEEHTEKMLEWRLTVWDGDDVASSNIHPERFYLAKAPIVTITNPPHGGTVNTATPVISWSSVFYSGRVQEAYRVIVYRLSDHKTLFDTGFRFSGATSITLPPNLLRNKMSFSVHVMVQDSNSLVGRKAHEFDALWEIPMELDPPVVDITEHATKGYAYVTAPAPDVSNYINKDYIIAYNILRRTYESGGQEWVTIYTGMPSGQEFIAVKDWLLPSGVPTEYAFTMTLDIWGEVQTGDPDKSRTTLVEPMSGNYWLIDVNDPYRSILLPHVTGDSWTDEYEQQDFVVINRGRIVEVGDRIGNTGTLDSQLRDRMNGYTGFPVINSAANARMLTDSTGDSVPSWVAGAGVGTTFSIAETHSFAPSPTDRVGMLAIQLTQGSGDPKGTLVQDMFRIKPGTQHIASVWFECSRSAPGTYFDLRLEYWDSQLDTGNVLATYTQRVTFQNTNNTSVPSGSNITKEYQARDNHYSWYRVDVPAMCPSGALKAKFIISMDSTVASNTINFNFGGAALTDRPSRFFDGYSPDAEWLGDPETDPSYTPGKYTARRQRQNIEAMKADRGEVVLRTPFGDVYRVQVGNIGVTRIPGMGSNEFVDISVPYLEIADD